MLNGLCALGLCTNGNSQNVYDHMENESMPKILTNDTMNIFLNCNQRFAISNHSSSRVLFDKIASVYFI